MNLNIKAKQVNLLILTPQDAESKNSSKLLQAIKRKRYQDPTIVWHVVLILFPRWFYHPFDSKKHQEDYAALNKLHYEVRYLLNVPYHNVYFSFDTVSNVIHDFKTRYSGINLPFNRSFWQYERLINRWYCR